MFRFELDSKDDELLHNLYGGRKISILEDLESGLTFVQDLDKFNCTSMQHSEWEQQFPTEVSGIVYLYTKLT